MSYTDIGDSELIYLVRANNSEAKNLLVSRYKKRIFGMIDSFVKKNNLSCVNYEDLFSECFMVFLSCLDNYDDDYNFYIYVNESVERKLVKISKKEMFYRQIVNLDDGIYSFETINDAKENYAKSEINSFLKDNFDLVDRQIVDLKIEGYSYNEIGKLLGVSDKSIYKRSSRIKTKISKIISN